MTVLITVALLLGVTVSSNAHHRYSTETIHHQPRYSTQCEWLQIAPFTPPLPICYKVREQPRYQYGHHRPHHRPHYDRHHYDRSHEYRPHWNGSRSRIKGMGQYDRPYYQEDIRDRPYLKY
jgi:hypothetical protein